MPRSRSRSRSPRRRRDSPPPAAPRRRDSPPRNRRESDRDSGRDARRPPRGYDDIPDQDRDRRRRDRDYADRDRERDRERDRPRRRDDRDERRSPPRRRRSPSPRNERGVVVRRNSRSRSGSRERSKEPNLEPNFKPSGLLAAATKSVQHADGTTTVLKYHEPPEARKPQQGWRLYVFKGEEQVDLLHIHRQSAYLIGRDHGVVDIPLDHPSCSKQHAAIQYRSVTATNEYGDKSTAIKPFIIDLESTNGTKVNDETIPASRYYELKQSDVVKFGLSLKEYVLLHDDAA